MITITTGNDNKWFLDHTGSPTRLPVVQLLLDEPTHWDSVYVMLNRLCTLRQAVDMFFQNPNQHMITDKRLTLMEWHFLQDLEVILEIGATNAYAVSMFIDPASWMSWMEHHWGQQQTNDAKKFIMKIMHAKRGTLASASAPAGGQYKSQHAQFMPLQPS
ncbi:hypothetical protein BDR03DRAFT_1012308 [Suillus americanus]|nr:hypothetical protein BDR03DRAFT_1012308 [Suillus americanus]